MIGWDGTRSHSSLLRYHDGSWSYREAFAPANSVPGQRAAAASVSCPTVDHCAAAGFYGNYPVYAIGRLSG